MGENEKFDSDFNKEGVPISKSFWKYMESYWHNHREFPESPEDQLKRKADLVGGKVPSSQLPSYVDDVVEFESFENLPNSGEKGKIYVLTNSNSQYRWSGSEYIQLNSDEHFMTTNTEQNITGKKFFITSGGSKEENNKLVIASLDHSLPGITFYKSDYGSGNINFNENGFNFVNGQAADYINTNAKGFKKSNSNDDYLLTGGGGHLNKYSKEDAWFHSPRNFPNGTLIETDIDYSQDSGDQFLLELKGNMYNGSLPLEAKIQGYIYYGTIISHSGYSTLDYWNSIIALNFNDKLCFWFPTMAYWQGFDVKVTVGYGGINQGKNRVTGVSDNPDPGGTKRVEILLKHLLTKEELVSKNIFQPFGNYTTLDTEQVITSRKAINKDLNTNDYIHSAQHFAQFQIGKSSDAKSLEFAVTDDGTSYIQSKEAGVGYNPLILNPSNAGGVGIGQKPVSGYSLSVSGSTYSDSYTGSAFYSSNLNGRQVFNARSADQLYIGNPQVSNIYIESGDNNLIHYRNGYGNGTIWDAHNFNPDTKANVNHFHDSLVNTNYNQNQDLNGYLEGGKMKFIPAIEATSPNMFPTDNNANSLLSISSWSDSNWGHELGFSSNGNIYHRYKLAGYSNWNKIIRETDLDYFIKKGGDTMTGTLIVNSPDSIGSNNLGTLPQNTKLFLANGNGIVANYGTVFWTEGTGGGYIQQQRADGQQTAYPLNLQPYGGGLFYGNNEVATVNQLPNMNNYIPTSHPSYSITQNEINGWRDYLGYSDTRQLKPDLIPTKKLQFGFTSWNNDFSGPYADSLHFGGYPDSTGGNQNLISFKKNGFGLRQFQGTPQSTTPYQSFVDFWNTGDFTTIDINNWDAAFSWGNHANAGYANYDFVEEKLNELSGEITNPDYPIYIRNKFSTIIITEDYHGEPLQLEGELIPESYISIINLSKSIVNLKRFEPTIDRISEQETTEYYINKEQRLIKKGSYRSAQILT